MQFSNLYAKLQQEHEQFCSKLCIWIVWKVSWFRYCCLTRALTSWWNETPSLSFCHRQGWCDCSQPCRAHILSQCCRIWFGCCWFNHFAESLEMFSQCLCSGSLWAVGAGLENPGAHSTSWGALEEGSSSSGSELGADRSSWASCPALQGVGVALELPLNCWRI